jgi:hypothetical protein
LVIATEVVESATLPLVSNASNLAEEWVAPEADAVQVATEPLVVAAAGGGDAMAASSKEIAPPPPSTSGHEVEVLAAAEASAPAASQAGGMRWRRRQPTPRLPVLLK